MTLPALPSPDIARQAVGNSTAKAASTSFVAAAVAALQSTLVSRIDIATYKKAINAYQTGGVGLMYAYSVSGDFGSPAATAFFAGSDLPGGDFETLVLQPRLVGSTAPATGAPGLGQTLAQAATTITAMRLSAAASITEAAITLPTAVSIIATGMAAWAESLPASDPAVPGAPWLDGGLLAFSV